MTEMFFKSSYQKDVKWKNVFVLNICSTSYERQRLRKKKVFSRLPVCAKGQRLGKLGHLSRSSCQIAPIDTFRSSLLIFVSSFAWTDRLKVCSRVNFWLMASCSRDGDGWCLGTHNSKFDEISLSPFRFLMNQSEKKY